MPTLQSVLAGLERRQYERVGNIARHDGALASRLLAGLLPEAGRPQRRLRERAMELGGRIGREMEWGLDRRRAVAFASEGWRGRAAWSKLNSAGFPMYLMIVRRGCEETFDLLRETFEPRGRVRVIWDRRQGERRSGPPVPEDRRQGERRQVAPRTWDTVNFVVARFEAESKAG